MPSHIAIGVLCQIFTEIDLGGSWEIAFFARGALLMKQWVQCTL